MKRLLAISTLVLLASCGGSDAVSENISSPCDLADSALVGTHFTGTVAAGVEGQARNCSYAIEGGDVISVDVFYYGDSSGWDGTRDGYSNNRGGVTDIDSLGDAAFYPNDRGQQELVVQSGGQIFSLTVFSGFDEPSPEAIASVAALAGAIADALG